MSAPDLTIPIRDALLANTTITGLLTAYLGSFPIFTRRPVPNDTPYPCLVVSQDIGITDEDGINDDRPVIVRDIAAYHQNEPASNYHTLNTIAYAVRAMFHRQRPFTLDDDWSVTMITASGPIDTRIEQDKLTGRVVQLTMRVAKAR